MHNKATRQHTDKKLNLQKSCVFAETRAPALFNEGAKKGRSCTRQPVHLSLNTKARHKTHKSSLECQKCRKKKKNTDKVIHCKTCTTLSMWFQTIPTLSGRENDHFTSKQEKLTE